MGLACGSGCDAGCMPAVRYVGGYGGTGWDIKGDGCHSPSDGPGNPGGLNTVVMKAVDRAVYTADRIRRLVSGVPFFNEVLRQDAAQFDVLLERCELL